MNDFANNANETWLDGMDEMEGTYQQESEEKTREEVPDGIYQVQVDKLDLVKAKSSGNTMLKWQLRIIAPTCIGRMLFKNHVFTQACIKFIKQDLGLCGFDHSKFRELPQHFGDLLDLQLEVAKRTNRRPRNDGQPAGYNVYFNRLIGRGSPEDGGYGASSSPQLNSF